MSLTEIYFLATFLFVFMVFVGVLVSKSVNLVPVTGYWLKLITVIGVPDY
jgi:tetrahydromethanopterin S-methyltransferase subunit D